MRALAAVMAGSLVLAAIAMSGGGCALFDGDPPDRSCRTDNDCFRAQGERCDQAANVCVHVDAGMVTSEDPVVDRTTPGEVAR